ncbi:hypothetical protein AB834_05865 [PVC group bacterium (ex Bugula neritina AB1)]|nr:hypothetical protein AB834_05865 [PVC group bacterium (ex Bugula neritina AB1)]
MRYFSKFQPKMCATLQQAHIPFSSGNISKKIAENKIDRSFYQDLPVFYFNIKKKHHPQKI